MYPSEYDSVTRAESKSANCTSYLPGILPGGVDPEEYIHCDGIQLKLTDSNFGQKQFQPTDYYVWNGTNNEQLLFIFPTRASLITITLHYYSDSVQGLPRLSFYAVPDDFDIWDAPNTSTPYTVVATVAPGGEPAGHRSVGINANLNTTKVQIHSNISNSTFALREVEFVS